MSSTGESGQRRWWARARRRQSHARV